MLRAAVTSFVDFARPYTGLSFQRSTNQAVSPALAEPAPLSRTALTQSVMNAGWLNRIKGAFTPEILTTPLILGGCNGLNQPFFNSQLLTYGAATLLTNRMGAMRQQAILAFMFSSDLGKNIYHAASSPDSFTALAYSERTFVMFLLGAATLRALKWFSQQNAQIQDVTEKDLQKKYGVESAHFDEAYGENPAFREAVISLEKKLAHDPEMLAFLGYEAKHFRLSEELKSLRMGYRGLLPTEAHYAYFNRTLVIPRLATSTMIQHELMHALHHRALARGIKSQHLLKLNDELTYSSLPTFMEPRLDKIRKWVQTEWAQGLCQISEEVREAAADLLFFQAMQNHVAEIESIGSRYDIANGGLPMLALRATTHTLLAISRPVAHAGGIFNTNQLIQSYWGYSNPLVLKRVMSAGLFQSIE